MVMQWCFQCVSVQLIVVQIVVICVLLYCCGVVCGLFGYILVVVVQWVLFMLVYRFSFFRGYLIIFGVIIGELMILFLLLVGVIWVICFIVVFIVVWKVGCGFLVLLIRQKLFGIRFGLNGLLLCVVSVGWNLVLLVLVVLCRLMCIMILLCNGVIRVVNVVDLVVGLLGMKEWFGLIVLVFQCWMCLQFYGFIYGIISRLVWFVYLVVCVCRNCSVFCMLLVLYL